MKRTSICFLVSALILAVSLTALQTHAGELVIMGRSTGQ